MKISLDKGAIAPTRSHDTDAGLDIYARRTRIVKAGRSMTFHTGVHVELPKGTCGLLVSKSGLNTHHGLTSTGLIDEGYSGEIVVKLYNHSRYDYKVNAGEKISQLVVIPILFPKVEIVSHVSGGDRGDRGFGSTGR